MRSLLPGVLAAAWLAAAASASPPKLDASFDYLYIEANEGGSSGGHTAIRFGTETYHFQNRDGLLVLDRERTADFLHDYALVNNRTVEASRVAVRETDAAALRAAFDHRYHVQGRQLDVAAALEEDRLLLEAWSRGEAPELPTLGYFALPARPARADAVEALRADIEERHGPDFLSARREQALTRLRTSAEADPTLWPAPPAESHTEHPAFTVPWARRYQDIAASVGAVDVLEAGAGLRVSALIAPEGPRHWLDEAELEALKRSRADLEATLVQLAGSPRPDWGRPFLVALARLLAVDESLRAGRLVVLDVIPEDARRLPHAVIDARLDAVAEMLRFGGNEIEALRNERVRADGLNERLETRLEGVVNRIVELEHAVIERRALRLARGRLLPLRPGPARTKLPRRIADREEFAADIERVREREEQVRDGLEDLYRYHLITRNCVSELFHTLDEGLGDSEAVSEQVLGGHVDGSRNLTFIPFISARAVDQRYRVVSRRVIPSYRETRISQMKNAENPWWVVVRESNTLTAQSYRRGHGDSYFLFFTDDQPLLRPVLGAANLVAATLESVLGLVWAPVDRGDTLLSGLEGMLVSLPELAFWNIRKGSNDWVTPRPLSLDEPSNEPQHESLPPVGTDSRSHPLTAPPTHALAH